jgi:Tfp pilus assembly protein PilF
MGIRLVALIAVLAIPAWAAAPVPAWSLAQSQHFEVYAQASGQRAVAILRQFEYLRAFFLRSGFLKSGFLKSGWKIAGPRPVRVIVFASPDEYQPYRLRATADAYYVGSGDQDYIVMAGADPRGFGLAAHEYTHRILRASGLQLPPWLEEGLAELHTTLRMDDRGTELGGPLPARLETLRKRAWMPLQDLTAQSGASLRREERKAADLFYAESWALTGMLALSPGYAAGFQQFIAAAGAGTASLNALTQTYAKSADAIAHDLRAWVDQRASSTVQLPPVAPESVAIEVSRPSPLAARVLLAQLLLAAGEFDRAEVLFSEVNHDEPDSAKVSAALGMIALHKGDLTAARFAWKRAIDLGIADAQLCYRYAGLADEAGLGPDHIRPALERAIELQPQFDGARYKLALLEKNAGRYEAALQQFQAMGMAPETRAYAYWLALADTFNELGRREEAQSAAGHAAEHAATAAERARAAQQIYLAQTDFGVQFARDVDGHAQLVTTRKPRQTTDWNPFIEPSDDVRQVQGGLREIDCVGNAATIRIEAAGTMVTLAIPDLQHVQMRHAPDEFVCGLQTATPVVVEYARTPNAAADGIVRGMDFE